MGGPFSRSATLTWFVSILEILIGFVILVWSADRFVLGAAGLARNLGVSLLVIGLTIVGFGTSAPEFLVSAVAAYDGQAELCVGNVLGSNIINISLVLGAAAVVSPMRIEGTVLRRELPILVGCMLLATILVADRHLGQLDGLLLGVALVVMMGWVVRLGLKVREAPEIEQEVPDNLTNGKAVFWLIVGLVLLLASSKLLVVGAIALATAAAVPQEVIGLSVVALGTSLPELAASVMAARRNEHELAVGNVVGSNMFNTLGVLALPGLMNPKVIPVLVMRRDIPAMFGVTLLFFVMTRFFLKPSHLSRVEGSILLLAFLVYMVTLYYTTFGAAAGPLLG